MTGFVLKDCFKTRTEISNSMQSTFNENSATTTFCTPMFSVTTLNIVLMSPAANSRCIEEKTVQSSRDCWEQLETFCYKELQEIFKGQTEVRQHVISVRDGDLASTLHCLKCLYIFPTTFHIVLIFYY